MFADKSSLGSRDRYWFLCFSPTRQREQIWDMPSQATCLIYLRDTSKGHLFMRDNPGNPAVTNRRVELQRETAQLTVFLIIPSQSKPSWNHLEHPEGQKSFIFYENQRLSVAKSVKSIAIGFLVVRVSRKSWSLQNFVEMMQRSSSQSEGRCLPLNKNHATDVNYFAVRPKRPWISERY